MSKSSPEIIEADIRKILLSCDTQSRTGVSKKVIDDYAQHMRDCFEEQEDYPFPPVVLFKGDGSNYCIGNGWHRIHAAIEAGMTHIPAEVHTVSDPEDSAIEYSCGADGHSPVHKSARDKRKAVHMLLRLDRWKTKSNRSIARHVGCSHTFVNNIRKDLGETPCGNVSTSQDNYPANAFEPEYQTIPLAECPRPIRMTVPFDGADDNDLLEAMSGFLKLFPEAEFRHEWLELLRAKVQTTTNL